MPRRFTTSETALISDRFWTAPALWRFGIAAGKRAPLGAHRGKAVEDYGPLLLGNAQRFDQQVPPLFVELREARILRDRIDCGFELHAGSALSSGSHILKYGLKVAIRIIPILHLGH